eukprot:Opistho-1_new@37772
MRVVGGAVSHCEGVGLCAQVCAHVPLVRVVRAIVLGRVFAAVAGKRAVVVITVDIGRTALRRLRARRRGGPTAAPVTCLEEIPQAYCADDASLSVGGAVHARARFLGLLPAILVHVAVEARRTEGARLAVEEVLARALGELPLILVNDAALFVGVLDPVGARGNKVRHLAADGTRARPVARLARCAAPVANARNAEGVRALRENAEASLARSPLPKNRLKADCALDLRTALQRRQSALSDLGCFGTIPQVLFAVGVVVVSQTMQAACRAARAVVVHARGRRAKALLRVKGAEGTPPIRAVLHGRARRRRARVRKRRALCGGCRLLLLRGLLAFHGHKLRLWE